MSYEFDPGDRFYVPPVGRYEFTVRSEPDKRKAQSGRGHYYIIKFWIVEELGERHKFTDLFVPWELRWKDLLLALGGQEDPDTKKIVLEDEEWVGKKFTAEIVHDDDKKRPGQKRARITNIHVPERQLGLTPEDQAALDQTFEEEESQREELGDVPPPSGKPDNEEIPF